MKESIKQYFKTNFGKKAVITKWIILAIAFVVVLIPSISFYCWLRNYPDGTEIGKNGFWYIQVTWNTGMGFSLLKDKTAAILAIQAVIFVVLLAVFWLFVHKKITCSFVALAMFGGLFNLIQRACTPNDGVLDYFVFGFWKNFATFNWPDMFVVIGIFGFIISYIVLLIIESVKDGKAEKPVVFDPPKAPAPTTPVEGK